MKEVIIKLGLGIFITWQTYYSYWFFKIHHLISSDPQTLRPLDP